MKIISGVDQMGNESIDVWSRSDSIILGIEIILGGTTDIENGLLNNRFEAGKPEHSQTHFLCFRLR